MADLTFKANLLPNTDLGKALGSENQRWNIYGKLNGNANSATKLSHTPNNTTTFLRGDNTWSNTLSTSYIADSSTASSIGFVAKRGNYRISLYSDEQGSGIWINARTKPAFAPLFVDSDGTATFKGRIYRGEETGIIYDDTLNSTYSGLVISGGNAWAKGAGIYLRNGDTNNDSPGTFGIGTANTSGSFTHWLVGRNNGLLTWDGGLSITTGATPGCGTATGHTISTNGNIGANAEIYANTGFYAGGGSPVYRTWGGTSATWYDTMGSYQNGDTFIRANGRSLLIGHGETQTQNIYIGYCNGTSFIQNINDRHTMLLSRQAGGAAWRGAAIEVREVNEVLNSQTHPGYAPQIGFHWGNICTANLCYESDNVFRFRQGRDDGIEVGGLCTIQAGSVWGAVWNDYAEMRNVPEVQKLMKEKKPIENYEIPKRDIPMAGRIVREIGDDTMELVNERLLRGCRVISDTFGFNIGETKDAKTPVAVSGRVLVYCYEGREEARKHIGYGVCSGPDGTVSIMTEEEERMYPMSIIGTISAVPDYDEWGEDHIKVNGRIWIYVK